MINLPTLMKVNFWSSRLEAREAKEDRLSLTFRHLRTNITSIVIFSIIVISIKMIDAVVVVLVVVVAVVSLLLSIIYLVSNMYLMSMTRPKCMAKKMRYFMRWTLSDSRMIRLLKAKILATVCARMLIKIGNARIGRSQAPMPGFVDFMRATPIVRETTVSRILPRARSM